MGNIQKFGENRTCRYDQDVDRTLRGRVNQNDRRQGKNGESTSIVWPTLGSRTAKDQIRSDIRFIFQFNYKFGGSLSNFLNLF